MIDTHDKKDVKNQRRKIAFLEPRPIQKTNGDVTRDTRLFLEDV